MSADSDIVRDDARALREWAAHLRVASESERLSGANYEAELLDRSAAALARLEAAEAKLSEQAELMADMATAADALAEALQGLYDAALPMVYGGDDDFADWTQFKAALEVARAALVEAGMQ